jgi:dipeptidyl aminopeptidase/acylaminoacyl peptidase
MLWAVNAFAQNDALSHESSELLEVFLSSRVSLTDKLPLHYTGIEKADSVSFTSSSNPFAARTTYLDGDFSADSSFLVIICLRMPYGAEPFWSNAYRFEEDKARAAAHRIAADVSDQISTRRPGRGFVITSFGRQPPLAGAVSIHDENRFLNDQADVFILNLDNGSYEAFIANPGVDQSPSWSPDGKWLAYSSSVDGNPEIYVKNVETGQTRRLTYSWAIEFSPCWSPTGHEIAFVSDRLSRPQVFIMDADGSSQRRLTTEGSYNESPAWSPRGDLIAYVRS